MNVHESPSYVISAMEKECKKLNIPLNFVKDLETFQRGKASCNAIMENGELVGVKIGILESKRRNKTRSTIFHESKHSKQFYEKGYENVEEKNRIYNELEAYIYEFRRNFEETRIVKYFFSLIRRLKRQFFSDFSYIENRKLIINQLEEII